MGCHAGDAVAARYQSDFNPTIDLRHHSAVQKIRFEWVAQMIKLASLTSKDQCQCAPVGAPQRNSVDASQFTEVKSFNDSVVEAR